jgi:multiple sugar transport system substrate-binding protein
MNKKVVTLGLLVAFGAAVVAQGTTPTIVSVWVHSSRDTTAESRAFNTVVQKFNDANKDVQIDVVSLPQGAYNEQVDAAALADALPCVLDFDGPNLYNYVYTKKLIPIDKYISAADKADFLPSIIRQGTYNKQLYSLGQFESGLALWGNRRVLRAAGIGIPNSLETAWSGNKFVAILEYLKKRGRPYPLDMKFNYGQGEWYTYGFAPIMQSFGGDLINRNSLASARGVLDGKAAVAGMTYFQNLVTKYVNTKTRSDLDFVSGKAAISFVGSWAYVDYKKALKDDLVLIPMPRFGQKAVTASGSWNFGISSNCPTPDAAAKVLKHLVSAQSVLTMSDLSGTVPSRKSSTLKSKLYGPKGELRLYVDQLASGVSLERPATPAYPVITNAFATAVQKIANGANPQNALTEAAKTIDADIVANGGYVQK